MVVSVTREKVPSELEKIDYLEIALSLAELGMIIDAAVDDNKVRVGRLLYQKWISLRRYIRQLRIVL
jgi:metal-sulfur cluster biosynthetic enzyme